MSYIRNPPFDDVATRLGCALKSVLREDSDLFTFEVNERTVTQRLAQYLESNFDKLKLGLKVDCEYNRMWVESATDAHNLPKRHPQLNALYPTIEDTDAKTVFPDIIVHLRGREFANILVIEAKRNAPVEGLPEIDRIKLYEFTRLDGGFRYPWGAFLNFRSFANGIGLSSSKITVVDIVWFRDGREYSEDQVKI